MNPDGNVLTVLVLGLKKSDHTAQLLDETVIKKENLNKTDTAAPPDVKRRYSINETDHKLAILEDI